jgi:sugar lactone lactonase YvrE
MDGLSFVNGMEMSPDGEFLLLCETGRARIHKYYLKGNIVITKLFLVCKMRNYQTLDDFQSFYFLQGNDRIGLNCNYRASLAR